MRIHGYEVHGDIFLMEGRYGMVAIVTENILDVREICRSIVGQHIAFGYKIANF
jgi:hypothetical protein